MEYFWMHRDQIYERGLSVGYKVFSPGHLLWLAAIVLLCILSGRCYLRRDERGKDAMRKGCGLAIVVLEYAKVIVLGLSQVDMREFVPLHLCSAAGLAVLVYALWPHRRWLGQLFAYAFMPSALLALVFPSTTMYPWMNFYCLHGFIFHALLAAFFVWLYMEGTVVPDYKGLWLGWFFMAACAVPIYFVDGAFGVNYMFIGMRSDVGILAAIWDAVVPQYGRAAFALVMAVIMLIADHLFYGLYALPGILRRKK